VNKDYLTQLLFGT